MHKIMILQSYFTVTYIILSLMTFIALVCVTSGSNQSQADNDEERSIVNISDVIHQQKDYSTLSSQSRKERGIHSHHPYYLHHHEHHHLHDQFHDEFYHDTDTLKHHPTIVKLVAPRRKSKDAGIAELLLVLAPLAAIPLIGSAALTTFTTLFATGAYGKRRRKRYTSIPTTSMSRDPLEISFTDPRHFNDQYMYHAQIYSKSGNRILDNQTHYSNDKSENEPTVMLNADTSNSWKVMELNPINRRKPKTQLVRLSVEDARNTLKQIDPLTGTIHRDSAGVDSMPLMHNNSASSSSINIAQQSVSTLVKVLEKHPYKETISSRYRQGQGILRKRDEQDASRRILLPPYKILHEKSPYHSHADTSDPDFFIKHYNESGIGGSKEWNKKKDKKKWDNGAKLEKSDTRDTTFSTIRFKDLSILESAEAPKMMGSNGSGDDTSDTSDTSERSSTDRFNFNTWIPFLSNPYMDHIAKDDGKREIQELDIIQKYLNTMGRPDYNDEIIATYLSCNGMLSASNHCLERLTCQFSDPSSGIKQLEKDVASLVIYSLLKNDHIDNAFKKRLQNAAFFGRDNSGRCTIYTCPKTNEHRTLKAKKRR